MTTLHTLARAWDHPLDDHLDDLDIPVIDGLQAQGDLLVVPVDPIIRQTTAWRDVPPEGVPVVRGAHTHTLVADPGTCRWTPADDGAGLAVVALVCTAPVWLLHQEHGAAGIAPGAYVIRRQREQSQEVRLVAD